MIPLPTSADWLALGLSGGWVIGFILLAEFLRRRLQVGHSWTRKLVHVAVGTWIVPTFLLYDTLFWAVVPPASFILLNTLSHRHQWMKAVDGEAKNYGSIFYPFSVALLIWWGWDPAHQAIAAAGVLVLAWGDAAASQVGRHMGRHAYHVAGHRRTLEGSLAMFAFSLLAILAAFALLPPQAGSGLLAGALIVALVATVLEGISLYGMDNLLVPFGTAAALWLSRGAWH